MKQCNNRIFRTTEWMPMQMHIVNTQYKQFNVCIHIICWIVTLMKVGKWKQPGLNRHSRDIFHRPGGSSWSSPLRLNMIRQGRLVLVIRGRESQNYSKRVIRLESTKIIWFSWWPGGRLDRLPGGRSRALFSQAKAKGTISLESTQIRWFLW